jgi:hypothetical protein
MGVVIITGKPLVIIEGGVLATRYTGRTEVTSLIRDSVDVDQHLARKDYELIFNLKNGEECIAVQRNKNT